MVKSGYKQTEIGVIPEDWDCVRLGEKAKIYRGGSPRPIQDYITTSSDGANWIKIGDVGENDKYIRSTQEKITPEGISKSREVHIGDFILSNSMSFGRPYILDIDGCIHDGWLTIQDYKNTFSAEYLYYLLSSDLVYQQYIGMAAGSSVKNLNKDKVSALYVIYTAVSEQERIAEALSDVDELISSLEKLIEKYKSIKATCLQQMFPQKGETTPKMRLPGFTGAWEQRKLGELSNIIDPHPSHRAPEEEEIGIPFVGIGDVDIDGNINYEKVRKVNESIYDEHHRRYDLAIPSLGIGRVASLGKVIRLRDDIGKYAVSPTMSIMQFTENSNIDFLYAAMNTEMFQRQFALQSNGSTRQSVGIQDLRVTEVSISPNGEEQKEIGAYFRNLDNLITLHQRKLDKAKKIKQGMMQQLLTGKIRLNN